MKTVQRLNLVMISQGVTQRRNPGTQNRTSVTLNFCNQTS